MAAGGGRPRWGVDMSGLGADLVVGERRGKDGPACVNAGEKREVDGGVGGE